MHLQRVSKTTAAYGAAMAAAIFVLKLLESQYALHSLSTETYIVALAILFTGVGIWIGSRLGHRRAAPAFEPNTQVISTLGITKKELQVLALLSEGGSNQDIAQSLFVSISTVKTHLVHLYQKLEVSRRTEAVKKARSLNIIA